MKINRMYTEVMVETWASHGERRAASRCRLPLLLSLTL